MDLMHISGRLFAVALVTLLPTAATAQVLGTFTWQQRPYCNRQTLTATASGGVFTLAGFDRWLRRRRAGAGHRCRHRHSQRDGEPGSLDHGERWRRRATRRDDRPGHAQRPERALSADADEPVDPRPD